MAKPSRGTKADKRLKNNRKKKSSKKKKNPTGSRGKAVAFQKRSKFRKLLIY